jgi:hypothetical protein
MKLIDYGKYESWSLRQAIGVTVAEVLVMILFLGFSLGHAVHGREAWAWLFPLAMGFASGVGALQSVAVAFHKRKLAASTGQNETAHNPSV